jgi:hypothetical protein
MNDLQIVLNNIMQLTWGVKISEKNQNCWAVWEVWVWHNKSLGCQVNCNASASSERFLEYLTRLALNTIIIMLQDCQKWVKSAFQITPQKKCFPKSVHDSGTPSQHLRDPWRVTTNTKWDLKWTTLFDHNWCYCDIQICHKKLPTLQHFNFTVPKVHVLRFWQ